MTPTQLKERLLQLAPGTQVEIEDLTGTHDHYHAVIVSPAFEGKLMVQQHRIVFSILQAEIDSGEVHALSLKTFSPTQHKKLTNA